MVTAHRARVLGVQTAPEHRSTGVGRALMTEVKQAARDDFHLNHLRLDAVEWSWCVSMRAADGARSAGGQRHCVLARTKLRDEVLMHLPLR